MDNLRSVLNIVLSKIPTSLIVNSEIQYDNINRDTFVKIAGYYLKYYSNDELDNLFDYIKNEYEDQANYVRGFEIGKYEDKEGFSVFDAILIFATRVLQEIDGESICRYENVLRWRFTSHLLEEDIFTTAYLAFQDCREGKRNRDFSWKPVIGNNNEHLNWILRQGLADNHFHLKGSAPQFPLSWINMMNHVRSKKYEKILEGYGNKRLSVSYEIGTEEEHLYSLYLKAALIRCFLFAQITEQEFFIANNLVRNNYDPDPETRKWSTENLVMFLLKDKTEIIFYRNKIQENIDFFRTNKGEKQLDYALTGEYRKGIGKNEVNNSLSGERWLMYEMFLRIYAKSVKDQKYFNLFYLYLVIKRAVRAELVQTNENIGFDNFEKYQNRKEDFIEDTPLEKEYIKMALKGTIVNQNILHLETRLTPRKTALQNKKYIEKYDKVMKNDKELMERYFYVFHFVKEKDNEKLLNSDSYCRHYQKRRSLQKQAKAIALFRTKFPETAKRLRGIDGCSREIGCRPEVLAQTYRYLKNHIVYAKRNKVYYDNNKEVTVPQLQMTYHVGEDFQSLVDGLRAIEEAIMFFNLNCGSRLGHALALGEDPDEYYEGKKNCILITQQDYLDNLVWVYYRIKRFSLIGYEDLLLNIEQEYNKYFRLIYGDAVSDEFFEAVIREAGKYFQRSNERVSKGYSNTHFNFRISEYYSAWQLRGDDPECYKNGYFKDTEDFSEWKRFSVNKECPRDYRIRYNPECAYLYFLYHYNPHVKNEGRKTIEVQISHKMIKCIKEIQREMQFWISKLGIGIEVNPSSNFFIGTFDRYDKHPVFKLYNIGLTGSETKLNECPQIPVCINTDDQGIFSTYLENEYALIALALEKAKDENGKNLYNRMFIYQWIENIRKLGLQLSFAKPESSNLEKFIDKIPECVHQ
ncbi:hypothetical protein [Blautia wexlerae]|uniref:hypothetical protein n=1 Tax=Blautia wexlerae TaxID=418240 RepID=UPI001898A031|nr:hypothetical protein [Blautia wexlerae]